MTESKGTCCNETNLTSAPNNDTCTAGCRPDWLLYTVPSIAFILGVLLFSMICRTQHRREKVLRRVAALKTVMNTASTGHTYTSKGTMGQEKKDSTKLQNSSETQGNLTKQEAQSYENVTAVIYSNEDKVNYCVIQDGDYITPDAAAGTATESDNNIYLQPSLKLTDTDGESYENMEGCVYSHPRQHTLKIALCTEDDDYINPDEEDKCNLEQTDKDYINPDEEHKRNLEQTDTESYENMDGSTYPNRVTNTSTHTVDEGWYECMDRRQRSERHT